MINIVNISVLQTFILIPNARLALLQTYVKCTAYQSILFYLIILWGRTHMKSHSNHYCQKHQFRKFHLNNYNVFN